jgi:hypothetical protein
VPQRAGAGYINQSQLSLGGVTYSTDTVHSAELAAQHMHQEVMAGATGAAGAGADHWPQQRAGTGAGAGAGGVMVGSAPHAPLHPLIAPVAPGQAVGAVCRDRAKRLVEHTREMLIADGDIPRVRLTCPSPLPSARCAACGCLESHGC